MFQIKIVENIKTQLFFLSKIVQFYEIMPKNVVEPERPQAVWRMRVSYWIGMATLARPRL